MRSPVRRVPACTEPWSLERSQTIINQFFWLINFWGTSSHAMSLHFSIVDTCHRMLDPQKFARRAIIFKASNSICTSDFCYWENVWEILNLFVSCCAPYCCDTYRIQNWISNLIVIYFYCKIVANVNLFVISWNIKLPYNLFFDNFQKILLPFWLQQELVCQSSQSLSFGLSQVCLRSVSSFSLLSQSVGA